MRQFIKRFLQFLVEKYVRYIPCLKCSHIVLVLYTYSRVRLFGVHFKVLNFYFRVNLIKQVRNTSNIRVKSNTPRLLPKQFYFTNTSYYVNIKCSFVEIIIQINCVFERLPMIRVRTYLFKLSSYQIQFTTVKLQ